MAEVDVKMSASITQEINEAFTHDDAYDRLKSILQARKSDGEFRRITQENLVYNLPRELFTGERTLWGCTVKYAETLAKATRTTSDDFSEDFKKIQKQQVFEYGVMLYIVLRIKRMTVSINYNDAYLQALNDQFKRFYATMSHIATNFLNESQEGVVALNVVVHEVAPTLIRLSEDPFLEAEKVFETFIEKYKYALIEDAIRASSKYCERHRCIDIQGTLREIDEEGVATAASATAAAAPVRKRSPCFQLALSLEVLPDEYCAKILDELNVW